MKSKRADIEFYREMMEYFQAESASKSARVCSLEDLVTALRKEITALRETHSEDIEALNRRHEQSMEKMQESYEKSMAEMKAFFEKRLDHMAEANAGLSQQLGEAISAGKLARGKKYGRSAEQRNLLNYRKGANRSQEEAESDGTPPQDDVPPTREDPKEAPAKEKGKGRRPKENPEGKAHFAP